MNAFQILALLVVGGLFLLSVTALLKGWATRREATVWMLIWMAAGIAIIWPGVTKIIANAIGIGRGADLLLYCTVVAMMVGFLMIYARMRRLRREMTLLVRHLAIRDAATDLTPTKRPTGPDTAAAPSDPTL